VWSGGGGQNWYLLSSYARIGWPRCLDAPFPWRRRAMLAQTEPLGGARTGASFYPPVQASRLQEVSGDLVANLRALST
jgi:hypothetical protein